MFTYVTRAYDNDNAVAKWNRLIAVSNLLLVRICSKDNIFHNCTVRLKGSVRGYQNRSVLFNRRFLFVLARFHGLSYLQRLCSFLVTLHDCF